MALLPNITAAVVAALHTPTSCIPDGAVALSYTNEAMSPLHRFMIQRQPACFLCRLVSVCFGTAVGESTRRCIATAAVPESTYVKKRRHGPYAAFAWLKWLLLRDALRAASVALFVDADVLLLNNPFAAAQAWALSSFDIRFVGERACATHQCRPRKEPKASDGSNFRCALNSGVMLVTSRRLVDAVLDRLPRDLDAAAKLRDHNWLDQDAATSVVLSGHFSWCPLPASKFVNL